MYLVNFWLKMFDFNSNIGVFEFWIPLIFYHFAFYAIGFLPETLMTIAIYIYFGGYLIALISSGVRRLHDLNFSGLWMIAFFIPGLNAILAIMLLLPSDFMSAIVDAGSTKPKE